MAKKTPIQCFVFLLLFYAFSVWAENAMPGLPKNIASLTNSPKLDIPDSPPNPMELKATWWRYFDVESSVLKERIENTMQQLTHVLQVLPQDEQADAKLRIDNIIKNLQVYLNLRRQSKLEPPAAHPIEKFYTPKQWLDIVREQRAVKVELQSETEDRVRNENKREIAQQNFDALTANYLTLSAQTPDKLVSGLMVIENWVSLAISGEQLRLQKAAIDMHHALLAQRIEEGSIAQERLVADKVYVQKLTQEIEKAEQELTAAHDKRNKFTEVALPKNLDTELGKAQTLLQGQQSRHFAIKEAIADMAVIRKKTEMDLALLLTMANPLELSNLNAKLQARIDYIAAFDTKSKLWREETGSDQLRMGNTLAELLGTADTGQNNELTRLMHKSFTITQEALISLQRLENEIDDVRLVAGQLQTVVTARQGTWQSGLDTLKTSLTKAWGWLSDYLTASLFKIGETPVTALGILRVLLIIAWSWLLSHSVQRTITHLGQRQEESSAFLYTVGRLAHYVILTIGISIGLASIGIDLSSFALIAGALSLGIGFGLQTIVSNFVSGLIVLVERNLRIGDFIELSSGLAGEVKAINVRSTLVTTPDLVDILVPNSEFINSKVINWTLTDASRRIHIPFGVAYGTDKQIVRKAGMEAAAQVPYTVHGIRNREPEVWLTKFGESSLDFELVVWVQPSAVKRPNRVRAAYYWELETALIKAGIEMPFPQRDIHIRSHKKSSPLKSEPIKIEQDIND